MADYGSTALTAWHIKRAGQLSASLVQQCRQARWNTLAHHLAQAPGLLVHQGWVLVVMSLVTVALVFKQHVALTMAPWQPANGALIAMSLMALFLQVAALPGVLLHKAQHSNGPLACFYMMLAVSVVILLLWLANGRATELAAGAALAMMINVLIYGVACLAMQAKRQPVGQGVYNSDTEWLFSNDDDEMELALAGIEPYSSMYGLSDH
ncbi:hypothetical protein [Atopomonas sediminilitoris]|uniref:hypothetical protein n=1 Tax=Atopomonas sediminilitoris TaxID=2919919 RepID=UPI001F4EB975|nr:hypothetical protein [Atopomonas sediminilitoris]MCJ8170757.1 hypothetical protein [Atopomonas sediminilitoris]